jgi:hypothetical protein
LKVTAISILSIAFITTSVAPQDVPPPKPKSSTATDPNTPKTNKKSLSTARKVNLAGKWTGYYRWDRTAPVLGVGIDVAYNKVELQLDDKNGALSGKITVNSQDGDSWLQSVTGSRDPDGSVELLLEATSYNSLRVSLRATPERIQHQLA